MQQLREATDRPLLGVGVGSPGVVDGRGVVLNAPNLGWADVDLTGILLSELHVPVYVANDANIAVLGEHTFGETAAADLMLLRIGTGVGAGLVVGGALVEGHTSAAGEIGHVVVDPAGARCPCGRVGCLETVLAVPHLRRLDRSLASVGSTLGEVLAPVVAALNLSEIVLAGPLDLLDGELRKRSRRSARTGDGCLVSGVGRAHLAARRQRRASRRSGARALQRTGRGMSSGDRVGLDIGATKVLGAVVAAAAPSSPSPRGHRARRRRRSRRGDDRA